MSTFVLKINNDDVHNIQKTISDIISSPNSGNSDDSTFDENMITFMTKSEYSEYILKTGGSVTHDAKRGLYKQFAKKCTICGKECKATQKIYTLTICNHQFHHKCINKCYKEKSSNNMALLSCPMCNSSTEELCIFN